MELPPRSKTANKQRQMKQIIKNQMAKYVRRGWINAVGRRAGKVKQDCRSGCMFFTWWSGQPLWDGGPKTQAGRRREEPCDYSGHSTLRRNKQGGSLHHVFRRQREGPSSWSKVSWGRDGEQDHRAQELPRFIFWEKGTAMERSKLDYCDLKGLLGTESGSQGTDYMVTVIQVNVDKAWIWAVTGEVKKKQDCGWF